MIADTVLGRIDFAVFASAHFLVQVTMLAVIGAFRWTKVTFPAP